jgi:hypothetical protein
MKICIWKTNHSIADTIADAIMEGMPDAELRIAGDEIGDADVHIVYGILRHDVFKKAKNWICVDRGYFGADHFSGTYRISLNGTQQTGFWLPPIPHKVELLPWRGFDHSKPVLICPPTDAVRDFFSLSGWPLNIPENCIIRKKGDPSVINFQDYNYILTFNSSVGWQGIAAGIPCVSDPTYSMVGSFFKNISLANLAEAQYLDRVRLLGCMSTLQLTLSDMRQGKLWPIVSALMSGLVSTDEKPSAPKSPDIRYLNEPNPKQTFNF